MTGIEIAATGDAPVWITKFKVTTSINGFDWTGHGDYVGVYDPSNSVKRKLTRSAVASFVRIVPLENVNYPCMRVDVLVYQEK